MYAMCSAKGAKWARSSCAYGVPLSRGFHFPDLPGPPVPPLQKLRLLEWGWVISREPPQLVLAVPLILRSR